MKRILIESAVVAAALTAMGVVPSFAAVHQVTVQSFFFSPAHIAVAQGDTVRWVWVSGTHTTTSGDLGSCTADGLWDAPISVSNPSFEYTFNDLGTLTYFCRPHCAMGMNGSVTVELATQSAKDNAPGRAGVSGFILRAAPIPFTDSAVLSFELSQPQHVRLEIFDPRGRWVKNLADRWFEAGMHQVSWDGRSEAGARVPAGVYYASRQPSAPGSSAILVFAR